MNTDSVTLTPEERHALDAFLGECSNLDVTGILGRNPKLAPHRFDLHRVLDRLYRRLAHRSPRSTHPDAIQTHF